MEELREELNKLREEVAELRLLHKPPTKHKKEPCQGVTGKGTPCRNGALPGMTCCRMHSREPKPPKAADPDAREALRGALLLS